MSFFQVETLVGYSYFVWHQVKAHVFFMSSFLYLQLVLCCLLMFQGEYIVGFFVRYDRGSSLKYVHDLFEATLFSAMTVC